MATKDEIAAMRARDEGCIAKSAPDEPLFTLCARDLMAPTLVELWASTVEAIGVLQRGVSVHTAKKIDEARRCAQAMREWQIANYSKVPD